MSLPCLKGVALAVGLMALAGCNEVLYSDVTQVEANEMVAVLAASQIASTRERNKDGLYSVSVAPEDVALAIALLRDQNLPREQFQTLGDVFGGDGIVGTPFEEQARFLHALNQELSAAVTAIAGVRSAKVLVTVPPRERFQTNPARATAAVVLHHEPEFETRSHVPRIKSLIAHAVPDLDYDAVEVALFPASGPLVAVARAGADAALTPERPWQIATDRPRTVLWVSVGAAVLVMLILLAPLVRRGRPGDAS